jgi:D-3-phosphoglycerate dehydrogenase
MTRIPVYVVGDYHEAALDRLRATSTVQPVFNNDPAKEEWPQKAVGLLIRWDTFLGEAEFSKATNLKVVVKQGVGVDNIDLEAAKRHGVQVYNTPAVNSEAVAELSLTLALALARRVCVMDRAIRRGEKLIRSQWFSKSLYQKTVGLVGMGNIGRELAIKWRSAMDAHLVAFDPYFPEDGWSNITHTRVQSLEELLKVSDVVTIQVPLNEGTRGLLGDKELALMKDQSILINTARGGIVDESALLRAVTAKKFWGVGLDAMNVEPPTLDAYEELLKHENVLMTPHVGGDTFETQVRSGIVAVETLLSALGGGQPHGRQA